MKTLQKSLLAAAILFTGAVSANAAVTYGAGVAGQPYVGAKASQLNISGIQGASKATAYGVYGGYQYDQNFGAEVEYQGSSNKEYTYKNNRYNLKAKTFGAYGTYKYGFNNTPFYAKAKLGIAKNDVTDTGKTVTYNNKRSSTGIGGGLGLGYTTGNFGVEATYDALPSSTKALSVGAHIKF